MVFCYQKGFLLWKMGTNMKTHSQTLLRDLGVHSSEGGVSKILLLLELKELHRRENRRGGLGRGGGSYQEKKVLYNNKAKLV